MYITNVTFGDIFIDIIDNMFEDMFDATSCDTYLFAKHRMLLRYDRHDVMLNRYVHMPFTQDIKILHFQKYLFNPINDIMTKMAPSAERLH